VSSSPWKSLIRDLRDDEARRPYLDDVRRRVGVVEAHAELEREIAREIAAALGRSAAKVTDAMARLEDAGRAVAAAQLDADERDRRMARFNALRREALTARHELLIHREAVGMRRNEALEIMYPIPAPLRREPRRDGSS
jgi:hypothetical protein